MTRANVVGVTSSLKLTLLIFYCFFSPLMESQAAPVTTNANNDNNQEISPFLVLGVGQILYSLPYTWPEAPDQSEATVLYRGNNYFHHISGISFHYRRRLIFWCTTDGIVSTGTFKDRTKLTNIVHTRVINGTGYPWEQLVVAGLAVDWINDKLYWTVQDEGKIVERDLETKQERTVVQSEGVAAFNGLVVYPYPNYGWIFWTNKEDGTIERVAVTGQGRQLVRGNLGKCVWPLEIDYSKQTVYWVNTCENTLRSLEIGDTELSVDTVRIGSNFMGTTSMTLFDNVLYWNAEKTIKATNKSIESGDIIEIYRPSESASGSIIALAVELVHPGKQPLEEEFLEIIHENIDMEMLNETCPPCINGRCIPPGLCACNDGWTGENCTTDLDECTLAKDGCDYECHNIPGGFYCSCNSSSYLDSDGRTCIPGSLTTTYIIDPTVSTSGLGIGPTETPPGDYESTSISLTNAGPIHSTTIMGSDTLLPALSSHVVVVLPTSSAATTAASGTPTGEIYYSTSPQTSFLTTTSIQGPSFLHKSTTIIPDLPESTLSLSDLSFLPKSTSSKSEPSLFPKSTSITLLASSHSSTSSMHIVGIATSSVKTRLLATQTKSQSDVPKLPTPTSSFAELHKTSTYHLEYSVSVTVSGQTAIAPSSSTFLGLPSSFSTAMLLLPSSTSAMASVATASPTPMPTTSRGPPSTTSVLSVVPSSPVLTPISSTYATQSQLTPTSVVLEPLETSTTASETIPTDADSSTDHLPGATEPSSDGMTLIIIAAASAGSCVILLIVVIIMIAAVVHYTSKRCGSYTVNPDSAKSSSGTLPSWNTHSQSIVHSSLAASTANHSNGTNEHTNGYSYRTKSFRGSSPTCSTNSFT